MNYEIIELETKTAVGISARTNNAAPDMGSVIGGLWGQFFGNGIYAGIPGKKNDKSLGIYSGYAGDEKDDYDITVACEADPAGEFPAGAAVIRIPAGRYARFIVEGDLQGAVAKFWHDLWQMDLNRSFICDFEEYQNADMEHAVIHIYIGLK